MKDKRILVTGGSGLLGSYIVEELLLQGFTDIEVFSRSGRQSNLPFSDSPHVEFTKGDISEIHPLTASIQKAYYIIHAAAIVTFHPKQYDVMQLINVEGTANVVNIALEENIKKLIHISSIAAIGRDEKAQTIDENTQWTPSKFNSFYGTTKYLAEQEVWRGFHEGLDMAIVNPSLIFGERLWGHSSQKIFKKVYNGIPYYPKGSTGAVDAKDVAKIASYLLQSDVSGERFIASSANIKYQEIFKIMAKSMCKPYPTKAAPDWIMSILWRLAKIKAYFSNSEPLITRETVSSSSHNTSFDNSKSLSIPWGKYRSPQEFLDLYGKSYQKSSPTDP